jgi:hypothetical protein
MRKLLALAPVLLLAGCHSAQVVTQRPTPVAGLLAAAAPAAPFDSTLTAVITAPRPAAIATPVAAAPQSTAKPRNQPAAQPRQTSRVRAFSQLATAGIATPIAKRLAHKIQRQRPTEGVAESGLGRVALFFIGVVLAVLAGLAALVNLIFSVGFFTALGYTAAGLVVLFLLYSLFSGGKKK